MACASFSTYPPREGLPNRSCDPICDRFIVKLYENRISVALADGCNLGDRSRSAAKKASKAFIRFTDMVQQHIQNLQDAAYLFLEGFHLSHQSIIDSAADSLWEAGNATMVGGMMLAINQSQTIQQSSSFKILYPPRKALEVNSSRSYLDLTSPPPYVFVCCNLGNCKAYHIDAKMRTVTLITNYADPFNGDNRGQLGPHDGEGKPNLKNLAIFTMPCKDGDLILLATDGIHSNFDPLIQGKVPADLVGLMSGCDLVQSWNELSEKELFEIRERYECQFLESLMDLEGQALEPQRLISAIYARVKSITRSLRQFMRESPQATIPVDRVEYPGRLDHSTCVCFTVGDVNISYNEWMNK